MPSQLEIATSRDWANVTVGDYYNTLMHIRMDISAHHGGFEHRVHSLIDDLAQFLLAKGSSETRSRMPSVLLESLDAIALHQMAQQLLEAVPEHQRRQKVDEMLSMLKGALGREVPTGATLQEKYDLLLARAQQATANCRRLDSSHGADGYAHNAALAGLGGIVNALQATQAQPDQSN